MSVVRKQCTEKLWRLKSANKLRRRLSYGMPICCDAAIKGRNGKSDLTAGLFLAGDRNFNHGPMGDGFGHGDTAFAVFFSLEQDL